ncbi:MAG: hypothetical protein JSS63_13490 [Bacteroidetes bacterium]|nr:hypothetical protein [Bacteroidota bacterium]
MAKGEIDVQIFSEFCKKNDLYACITVTQITELSDVNNLHSKLFDVLLKLPVVVLANWDKIISKEIQNHPYPIKEPLVLYFKRPGIQYEDFERSMNSIIVREGREDQRIKTPQFIENLEKNKKNFPTNADGKYGVNQLELFQKCLTFQFISSPYLKLPDELKNNPKKIKHKIFKGIGLFSKFIFYKYYIKNEMAKSTNDFVDLNHLFFIPYCKISILEKNMNSILNELKRHTNILPNTDIKNISFLRTL